MPETNHKDIEKLWRLERDVALMKQVQGNHARDIEELKETQTSFQQFLAIFNNTKELQKNQHAANMRRLNVIITLLGVLIGLAGFILKH